MTRSIFAWAIKSAQAAKYLGDDTSNYYGPNGYSTNVKEAYVFPTATMALRHRENYNDRVILLYVADRMAGGIQEERELVYETEDTGNMGIGHLGCVHDAVEDGITRLNLERGHISDKLSRHNINLYAYPDSYLRARQIITSDVQTAHLINNYADQFLKYGIPLASAVQVFYDELTELILTKLYGESIVSSTMVFKDGHPAWSDNGFVPGFFQPGMRCID